MKILKCHVIAFHVTDNLRGSKLHHKVPYTSTVANEVTLKPFEDVGQDDGLVKLIQQ